MQDDRAFKCSRCGEYEYETELAEQVCKNCASKPPHPMEGYKDVQNIPVNTALVEEMDKCKTLLFRYFQERDARMVETLMRKIFSDKVVDILRDNPKRFIPMIRATGIKVFLDGNKAWAVIGSYDDVEPGIRVAETEEGENKVG